MTEDWELVKDFVRITESWDGFIRVFKDFLKEERGMTDSEAESVISHPRFRDDLKNMASCIVNADTEDGVKSCITINFDNIEREVFKSPNVGKMILKLENAERFYNYLKKESSLSVKDTWGEFIL